MEQGRVASGRRAGALRRLGLNWLMALVAALSACALTAAGPAQASSGGASLNGGAHAPAKAKRKAKPKPKTKANTHSTASVNPFGGRGMWIWYVSRSNGGSLSSIIATARKYGITTVMVKAGDGSSSWSQFNRSLVSALHAAGIHVCAWQYVYGNYPAVEARIGAAAAHAGADCLVIDAESEYQGKYISAQTYMADLRALVGASYPVALASFPYVDYHPSFPYSVFLGPNGAQYNTPQMYWKDIGTSVDNVYSHTYAYNRVYGRAIDPLGQVYNHPASQQIIRFRALSRTYGFAGASWWDWQEATAANWRALIQPTASIAGYTVTTATPLLKKGSKGDLVVWAQEHLVTAGYTMPVDGGFGPQTLSAVQAFQTAHGLTADGVIGPDTWSALLAYAPATVLWTKSGAQLSTAMRSKARRAGARLVLPLPKNAAMRAKRYEIPAHLGAG
jgi:peptidoglycan hydrolase-like protein with peptidoglycan-binding domain